MMTEEEHLSQHFTLSEMTRTSKKIANVPNEAEKDNLRRLCNEVLEPIRAKYGKAINVSSGFRNKAVNAAVGGAATSQHVKGEAADIYCNSNRSLWDCIVKCVNDDGLEFGQLIWEFGDDNAPAWIHISLKTAKHDEEVLKAYKKNGRTVYQYMII